MITHKVEVFKLSIQIQFKVLLPSGCQGQGANKNRLTIDNFRSVGAITKVITQKRKILKRTFKRFKNLENPISSS